jgi:hypothetical protein
MTMIWSGVTKQLVYYPLMVLSLITLVKHSDIDPRLNRQTEISLEPVRSFVKSAEVSKLIGDKKALELIWKLPQVQHKNREIVQLSKGSIQLATFLDSSPQPNQPYYIVRVFENHPDKSTNTVYWFRVLNPSGVIQALDLIDNEYIPLEKWHPDGV